jgi:aspartate/glutamate racemase
MSYTCHYPIDDFIADTTKLAPAFAQIAKALRQLQITQQDTVVIACNTAHLLQNDIERALGIKILSIVNLTTEHIARNFHEIMLFASPTTIKSGLYTEPLRASGVIVQEPTTQELNTIEQTIRAVIATKPVAPLRPSSVPRLLGCTELSCAFGNAENIIDPMEILINQLIPQESKR